MNKICYVIVTFCNRKHFSVMSILKFYRLTGDKDIVEYAGIRNAFCFVVSDHNWLTLLIVISEDNSKPLKNIAKGSHTVDIFLY